MSVLHTSKASFAPTGVTFFDGKGLIGSSSGSSSYSAYEFNVHKRFKREPKQQIHQRKQAIREGYKVNKSMIRAKSEVFMRTPTGRKFMAFYSLSFPLGFIDQDAMKCLNIWLTRVRKMSPKINYLWVAERQKNGTIHFHVLVDRFLNIRVVNHFMAVSIDKVNRDQGSKYGDFNRNRYNGVDVKRVFNAKGMRNYLAKYMTKANEIFNCRANGMSRYVSALFTKVLMSSYDALAYCDSFKRVDDCQPFSHALRIAESVWWLPYERGMPSIIRSKLDALNEILSKSFFS